LPFPSLVNDSKTVVLRIRSAEFLFVFLSPDQNPGLSTDPGNDERSRNISYYLGEENFRLLIQNFDPADPDTSGKKILSELKA